MAALNKVMLLGNVGHVPELRQTQSGLAVANFSVATSEGWKDGAARQERTEWHQVVVWGKLAETCGQYLTKGRHRRPRHPRPTRPTRSRRHPRRLKEPREEQRPRAREKEALNDK